MTDKIFLYHGFRNISDTQFVNGNISLSCRGEGAGGQSDGFYVWNNIENTVEYLSGYKCNDAVICKIEISDYSVALKYIGDKELKVSEIYDEKGNKSQKLTDRFLPAKKQQTLPIPMFLENKHLR